MRDVRIDRWAEILVNYSLQVQKGEHVVIVSEVEAKPLVEACYEKFLQAGAIVEPILVFREWSEIQFKYATDEQLKTTMPLMRYAAENCDVYLYIGAETNSRLLANVDPKKQALVSQGRSPILLWVKDTLRQETQIPLHCIGT
ncbi:MAG: hypothetical protein K940chlam7_00228 [Chlamydiae bacterium]|nr:hypothetical protein [Chlamydiota bacterium]